MTKLEFAQLISDRIGNLPSSTDESLYDISYKIYSELGGDKDIEDFDSIYELLLEVRGLAQMPVPYDSLEKVADYLYKADYSILDYNFAKEHMGETNLGSCSAYKQGNLIGRNYDWWYNNEVSFFIRTPHTVEYKSTIGIAGSVSGLTKDFVESRIISSDYTILPFYLQDGMNESGLFAEINVVPKIDGKETQPTVELRERIPSVMLVRYILDHYDTVSEAVADLSQYVQIYTPSKLLNQGYEAHFLLADNTQAVVIEFIDGEIKVINSNLSTNFHLYNVTLNEDGTVNTPETAIEGKYPADNGIEDYGTGLERYNIMSQLMASNKDEMFNILDEVIYSKTYTDPDIWYSEFVGGEFTVNTPANDPAFETRVYLVRALWPERSRDEKSVWYTTHSCVYDLEHSKVYVRVDEQSQQFELGFADAGKEEQIKSIDITSNGDYTVLPDAGKVLSEVDITVNVECEEAVIEPLNVTENGVYNPESGVDGFSPVTVNVKTWEDEYEEALAEIVELQADVATLEAEVSLLESQIVEKDATIAEQLTQIQSLEGQVTTLQAQILDLNDQITAKNLRIAELEALIATVTTKSISANGTYTAPEGVLGWNAVTVNVPDTPAVVTRIDISANGTYIPESGVDGFDEVVVNVPTISYLELTQAEYDALAVKDNNVIYLIIPE